MSDEKADLASAIKDSVGPVLKHAGFKRKGLHFTRELPEVWHLVSFQKSRSSTAARTSFTVNLGVASKRVLQFTEFEKPPAVEECHWQQRLGQLGPERTDLWWELGVARDDLDEVANRLRQFGLPALEPLSNDAALRDLWLTGSSPGNNDHRRLLYLSTVLAFIGPPDRMAEVKAEMQAFMERTFAPRLVVHLRMLEKLDHQ
jgi:hypothetical protein